MRGLWVLLGLLLFVLVACGPAATSTREALIKELESLGFNKVLLEAQHNATLVEMVQMSRSGESLVTKVKEGWVFQFSPALDEYGFAKDPWVKIGQVPTTKVDEGKCSGLRGNKQLAALQEWVKVLGAPGASHRPRPILFIH